MIDSYNVNDNVLTIKVSDRIDSKNASNMEADLLEIINNNAHEKLVLDLDELEYLSSAGLRIILKIKKQETDFKITNVNSEVYDIFEMTGFSEIMNIEKAFRKLSIDGCKIIGKGAKGTVYRYSDEIIVKVYNKQVDVEAIQNERKLAKIAFVYGVPTAISFDIAKVNGDYASVFELIAAKSLTQVIQENHSAIDEYAPKIAFLLKQIHSITVKPNELIDAKLKVYKHINKITPYLEDGDAEKLVKLVDEVPNDLTMLHNDFHTNNIMLQDNELILIDMDTLCCGNPIFELSNIYITYVGFGEVDPLKIENFMELPLEVCNKIWYQFFPLYLGTTDKEEIEKAENKVKLLNYIRYLNTALKEDNKETAEKIAKDIGITKIISNVIPSEKAKTIKDLRQDFIDTEQELWTNLTISIANCKFKVEFFYDNINNDERKFFIKEVGKYDEVTLETEIKVFSFNLKDNKEDTITEQITYDYLIDFTNAITEVEWVEFTTVCTDKSLLRNVNGIKAVLELMLV